MALTLTLPPDLEDRLTREARREGVSPDQYAAHLLERCLPADENRAELIGLLRSWIDEGPVPAAQEQEVDLTRLLDEDRLSDRKLFPPELKGMTW